MSESALVRAVRDQIRLHTTVASDDTYGNASAFNGRQVEVEFDEAAPATVGDLYIMCLFGGVEPGPTHNTSGGVIDKIYGIDVAVAIRSPRKPRDRKRELWIDLAASFEIHVRNIETQIDFDYATLTAANAYITAEYSSSDGFIEPLKFAGVGPIRQAAAEVFAGVGDTQAALIRTVRFRGARRIENR